MYFQKQDLAGTHYNPQDEHTQFTGQPTRRMFDRFNGNQVVFIINSFGSLLEKFTLEEAREIELQIATRLPIDIKSEISVFNWIRNWSASPMPHIF